MPNITLSVSEELKRRMDELPEVSWSDVCRRAIVRYIESRTKSYSIPEAKLIKCNVRCELVKRYGTLEFGFNFVNFGEQMVLDRLLYKLVMKDESDTALFTYEGFDLRMHEILVNETLGYRILVSKNILEENDRLYNSILINLENGKDFYFDVLAEAFYESTEGILKSNIIESRKKVEYLR